MQQLMLLDDLITMLAGIWKYSGLDYFLANKRQVSKDGYKANEYAIRLVRLWERLDMLSEDVIVKAVVELKGSIIGKKKHLERAATDEWKKKAKPELALFDSEDPARGVSGRYKGAGGISGTWWIGISWTSIGRSDRIDHADFYST